MKYFISIYIFATVLFLAACEQTNSPANRNVEAKNTNDLYIAKGKEIASSTFVTLSSNLQKAMKAGGVSNAINYCNLNTSPIVDSLANQHQATIKRTSLKIRNPNNIPTPSELTQLQLYQKQTETNKKLKPVIKEKNGQISFYAPIHVMPACQKCHGKIGKTMLEEDYKIIQQFYPNDKAINYSTGELRGMWSISFPK